ncbi:MAG: hypothetical protein JSV21_09375 [Nitrospirota bacterium]|nr:MAG: hypothetical protein JSV21_09375 [Nitrospirota bacterium]
MKKIIVIYIGVLLVIACSNQIRPDSKGKEARIKHSFCSTCHMTSEPVGPPPDLAGDLDTSDICISCHDYEENHHPNNVVSSDEFTAPEGSTFPLYNGRVKCLTCHEVHGGEGLLEAPKLLRGGPYDDRRAICFKCHFREKYAEIYVHDMKDDKGDIVQVRDKPVCLMCHSVVPDPGKDRTRDVKFRADVGFLCWRCHPPMPQEFFKYHFLNRPSRKVWQNMRKSQRELDVVLPIVPRNRITCSTCHNPHDSGVIVHEPAAKGADAQGKLRLQRNVLCNACHRK